MYGLSRLWIATAAAFISDIIAGIDYVTQHANEISVANLSFGLLMPFKWTTHCYPQLCCRWNNFCCRSRGTAVYAESFSPASNPDGITVVAIADSDGRCGGFGPATKYGNDDSFATFSNFGSVVDIAAPGVNILSTYKGGLYATFSGTRRAAPDVTGLGHIIQIYSYRCITIYC